MSRFGASHVLVRRQPPHWPIFVVGIAIPALLALAGAYVLMMGAVLLEALLLLLLPAMLYEDAQKGRRIESLYADAEGVWFGPKRVLERRRVQACALEALADEEWRVQLWGKRVTDDLSITLPDRGKAHALIEALGLRHDRHAARFLVESAPLRRRGIARAIRFAFVFGAVWLALGFCFAALRFPPAGFGLVPAYFVCVALIRAFRRREWVTLGADALVVRKAIPIADVHLVEARGQRGAVVGLRDGTTCPLRFDGKGARDKRDAFVARLRKSIADLRDAPVAERLAPGERDASGWLADLRRLASADYRMGAVPTEDLWRVVEHPGAEPGARVGALAVLVPRLDEEGRVRIADLAGGTVEPGVRAALETAAQADATDEAVIGAFEQER